jgi:16S rRNA (guanine(966)-N(2))-methyltransferase RsmD
MRIIAGTVGGRRIRAPRGMSTRPTSDRVREAVFNILGPPREDARVLDLYAGAGALGLEALSRGAAACVFVDQAAPAVRTAKDNASDLGLAERARVVRAEALAALSRLARDGERFTWVFVDPPYASDQATRALATLGAPPAPLLDEDAVVVVEHDRRRAPDDRYGAIARADRRRYGDTEVSFYRRAAA